MADTSWPRTPIKDQPRWTLEWQHPSGAWQAVESATNVTLKQAFSAARLLRDTMPGVETRVK